MALNFYKWMAARTKDWRDRVTSQDIREHEAMVQREEKRSMHRQRMAARKRRRADDGKHVR